MAIRLKALNKTCAIVKKRYYAGNKFQQAQINKLGS